MRTRKLLRPRVGNVLALVDPALGGHVTSVHDFRVAARSLRAALRTLSVRPTSPFIRETRHALGDATRALAEVRDRDVGRSLLARIPVASQDEGAVKRRMVGLAESDRRVALSRSATEWSKDLGRLLIELLDRGEPALPVMIRRTRAEAWQQRRRSIALVQSLGRRYYPYRLHELRIRIRRLRYALEALAEVDTAAHARVIQLKPLQGALGDAQDRIVLSRWLQGHARRFQTKDPSFASALRSEAARFRTQAMEAHASFLKLRPRMVLNGLALHVDPAYEHSERTRRQGPRSRPRRTTRTS